MQQLEHGHVIKQQDITPLVTNQRLGVDTELESSGDYSTKPQLKDLFMPSSPPIWTIATPSLPASLFLRSVSTPAYSKYSSQNDYFN